MAGLIPRLVQRYDEEGIPFCHWKGAAELGRALRGERDLDLLVSPDDYPRAVQVLLRAGWRQVAPLVGRDDPGTSHFLGHDPSVDRLLHVHLHDRVLTGENLINSHVVPFGPAILEDAVWHLGVRTASPAAVAVMGVLKAAIRMGSLPDRLASRIGRSPKSVEMTTGRELEAAAAWLRGHGSLVDEEAFRACAALLGEGASSRERRRLARQMRSALRPWSRYTRYGRYRAYARWLAARLQRLVGRTRSGRVLATGGAWIIFISSSEEPTPVHEWIGRWLGREVASKTFRCRALSAGSSSAGAASFRWTWRGRRVIQRAARAADRGVVALTEVAVGRMGSSFHWGDELGRVEALLAGRVRRPDAVIEIDRMDIDAVRSVVWKALGSGIGAGEHSCD